jgi:Tfp pilus assembly ATPase PilU
MRRSGFDGMQTFNQSLLQLVERGRISGQEAIGHSLKPSELAQALRGRV